MKKIIKDIFAAFFLFAFPPLFLVLVWNKERSKGVKAFLIILTVFMTFAWIGVKMNDSGNDTDIEDKKQENVTSESAIKEAGNAPEDVNKIDTSILDELMNIGFTNEEASEMQGILNSVGVNAISEVQFAAGDGIDNLQSFVCDANNDEKLKFYFTVENRKLFYAGFIDEDLYDADKGGALKQIQDVHIPERAMTYVKVAEICDVAEDKVKANLNYPETADFDTLSWICARADNDYTASGELTAKNAFGVPSKISFTVYLTEVSAGEYNVRGIDWTER